MSSRTIENGSTQFEHGGLQGTSRLTRRGESRTGSSKLQRAAKNPALALHELIALTRGHLFRLRCRLFGVRFHAGPNLRIEGRLDIQGPGRVIFGSNVRVAMTVTPWTHARDATIIIGDNAYLNGASFGCRREIRIGPNAILGRCFIMDTDFHSVRADRHTEDAPVRDAPVLLEENVWIGAQAGILPGTTIGKNSVVGFGAVCSGSFPGDVVIAGNPARVVKPLPALPDDEPHRAG
jgi:acetyltransferase-like isoleucine patch superfamily enzyme